MAALLAHHSRDSFESGSADALRSPSSGTCSHHLGCKSGIGNTQRGHQRASHSPSRCTTYHTLSSQPSHERDTTKMTTPPPIFFVQSYLRFQGAKFVSCFDANCYIHITRKLDTHDAARGQTSLPLNSSAALSTALVAVLTTLLPRMLVISIETDGLFSPSEQKKLATHAPESGTGGHPII